MKKYKIKKYRALLLLALIITFLFGSCRKEDQLTVVLGKVVNKITGEGVAKIPIEIIECDEIGKCLTTIKTEKTDINGNYKISFLPDKRRSYSVAVGQNNILGSTPYPYYPKIQKNIENVLNFEQFPLKSLLIRITVQRHNKNFLQVGLFGNDAFGYYGNDLYVGNNPSLDFDSTYLITLEAGREYKASVILSNKTAPYTYIDPEFFSQRVIVNNVDTTRASFLVQ